MLIIEKITYSIRDVYILMQENNYFICAHDYEFKNVLIFNSIVEGQLFIDGRKILFEIDSTNIDNTCNDNSCSIVIDEYVFVII